MTRDTTHVVKAGTQSAENPFTFIMSSETKDRVGDVIRAKGWDLTSFKSNPVALFGHDHGFPIGNWKNVRVEGKRLLGDLQLAAAGTSARIDEIRSLIEQRILKAVSVGFRITAYTPIDEKDPWGAWDITKSELLETSVVSVPANPDAVSIAKSLNVSPETQRLVFAAGQQPTPSHRLVKATPADHQELIGEPSDLLRARARLRRDGLI